jgi:bile acid-coenzyme A ligase
VEKAGYTSLGPEKRNICILRRIISIWIDKKKPMTLNANYRTLFRGYEPGHLRRLQLQLPAGQILSELAQSKTHDVAISCGRSKVTFADLESRANRLARAYQEMGVAAGSLVAIGLPNSIAFFEHAYASWKVGATPFPLSYRLPSRELDEILVLAKPAIVVGLRTEGAATGSIKFLGRDYQPDSQLSDSALLPHRISPIWKAVTSGGSTGRPKVILAGEPSLLDPAGGADFGMAQDGVHMICGPLYHNAPFFYSTMSINMGARLELLERFDAEVALDTITRRRVTWTVLVPTMMLRMLRAFEADPSRYDLSSLRVLWHMAAPCPIWLKQRWIDLLGADSVMELYGGTEGQAITRITGVEWLSHKGSVGRVAYGEMKILEPSGNEAPRGTIGEIFMRTSSERGPSYKYVGAEARRVGSFESLGDLGWMDEEGYLYLSDRRTDMILSGGANVYPAEIESALLEHPAVVSAVVVGLKDEDLGERVHAVIQVDRSLDADELKAFLSDRLVRYKIPRSFRFVNEPLRDDAGKVRRLAVRDYERQLFSEQSEHDFAH